MLTARTDTLDVVVGLECGADDYLRKPFDITLAVQAIYARAERSIAPQSAMRDERSEGLPE